MQLRVEQLERALDEGALARMYLIAGDEPLQHMEAADRVRAAVRRAGADERVVLDAGTGFDWGTLAAEAGSLSLFGGRRLLDLRLGTTRPGSEGAQALQAFLRTPATGDVLLLTMGRLDGRARQSAWFKAVDRDGVVVQVYPIEAGRLPAWIERRAKARGLRLPAGAAALIAERAEGNLLAAAQEIDKLRLVLGDATPDLDAVRAVVYDSARFDPFDLIDAALGGDAARSWRIVHALQAEGLEPALIAGALRWAVHSLYAMAGAAAAGAGIAAAVDAERAWKRRRAVVLAALERRPRPRDWHGPLRLAARLDRTAKGMNDGEFWAELGWLSLALAGAPIDWAETALLT